MRDEGKPVIALLGLLVVAVVLGIAALIFFNKQDDAPKAEDYKPPSQSQESGGSGPPDAVITRTPRTEVPNKRFGDRPIPASADARVKDAAIDFARAMFSEHASQREFLASVQPFTTPGLQRRLTDLVDYSRVPIYQVSNRANIFSRGTNDALVDVVVNGTETVRVYVVGSGDSFKADDYGKRGGVR